MNTYCEDLYEEWSVEGYLEAPEALDVVAEDFNETTEFFSLFGSHRLEGEA